MTRIAQNQIARQLMTDIFANYKELEKAGKQVSSGYKVEKPGDSDVGGSIQGYHNTLDKLEGFQQRIGPTRAALSFQDDIVKSTVDMMQHAKELATQAANESYDTATRKQMAAEVFQMRDQLVAQANSKYQGSYIYGQADDDDAPFDASLTGYTEPTTGTSHPRYVFDGESGTGVTQSVNVGDGISVRTTTSGQQIFESSITALETLGRALEGYDTTIIPEVVGVPDGGGAAYTLPTDRVKQTVQIQLTIDLIETSLSRDLIPERVDLGARLQRLDVADSVLENTKLTATEGLNDLQNADSATAISRYQQAQYSLQAAMQVTSKVLNLSILDYL